jgi:outer membrane immunogenic protein
MLYMLRRHRKLFGMFLLSAVPLAPAMAADLYGSRAPAPSTYVPPAAYVDDTSWAGFYAGINGGYAWGNSGGTIGYTGPGSFVDGDASARTQPQGGFGGGQIGYNFQSGHLVYGVEADFQGGMISDRITGVTANGNDFSSRESVDWFGTARARLGYSLGRALIYGTGGFAYGDVREHASVTDTAGPGSASLRSSGVQTGYAAGGGVEYKVTPNWSLKGEYLYTGLGNEKLIGLDTLNNSVTSNSLDTSFSSVKIGLNYRFGGGAEPLK